MFVYWIYFEKTGRPEKIVANSSLEFADILKRMIERNSEMPEWINKVYK